MLLCEHHCHLVLLCVIEISVLGFAVVGITGCPEPVAHFSLLLGCDFSEFLDAQLDADGTGHGIVPNAQPGFDDLPDVVGDRHGWHMHISDAARGEPSKLLPILLDLGHIYICHL